MTDTPSMRLWAEIDTRAWKDNFRALAAAAPGVELVPVIKANAYGLGARQCWQALRAAGAVRAAVATVEEGAELLDLGPRLQLLGVPDASEISGIVELGLAASVPDLRTAGLLSAEAGRQQRQVPVHILVDTGMGRLGLLPAEVGDACRQIMAMPGLEIEGISSHFPASECRDQATLDQIALFAGIIASLEADGIRPRWRHLANSRAVLDLPESLRPPFNMARPGICLHGAEAARPLAAKAELRPVMALKTRLEAVRRLAAGGSVGYGRGYRLDTDKLVGTVPLGYADGYPFALGNRGRMLVRGQSCPVIGRVCMDYTMLDLDGVPDAAPGDEVVAIGRQGAAEIRIEEVAAAAQTISYEILCGLGRRVRRVYAAS